MSNTRITYESAYDYINTRASVKAKITAIDAIITALLDIALKSASTDNIEQYTLDDGQTKINTTYKGTDEVMKSISSFEKLKDYYIAQYNRIQNGRMTRLVDSKNFPRR